MSTTEPTDDNGADDTCDDCAELDPGFPCASCFVSGEKEIERAL